MLLCVHMREAKTKKKKKKDEFPAQSLIQQCVVGTDQGYSVAKKASCLGLEQ